MPQESLPKQALFAKVKGKRPVGRSRTYWEDYIEDIGWKCLRLQPSEMLKVMTDRVMCGDLILSCRSRHPHGHERALKEEDTSLHALI